MGDLHLELLPAQHVHQSCIDPGQLRELAARHVAAVPFSNLRIHRGTPATVDVGEILERVVSGRDGGICYELNGSLALLLRARGITVHFVAARVLDAEGQPGPARGHMACVVSSSAGAVLVDVGFGGQAVVQPAPHREILVRSANGASYLVDPTPRELSDFAAMAHWHSTDPRSRFQRSLVVSSTRAGVTRTLSASGNPLDFSWRVGGAARSLSRGEAALLAHREFGLHQPIPEALLKDVEPS